MYDLAVHETHSHSACAASRFWTGGVGRAARDAYLNFGGLVYEPDIGEDWLLRGGRMLGSRGLRGGGELSARLRMGDEESGEGAAGR